MKRQTYIFAILLSLVVSCTGERSILPSLPGEIQDGEMVQFTTSIPKPAIETKALNNEVLSSYSTIAADYEINVTMLRENNSVVSRALYKPLSQTSGSVNPVIIYDSDGTLTPVNPANSLLWETSTGRYAFEATAGTQTVAADQSDPEKWIAQDRLHGYAFSPFIPEDNTPADLIDAPNYHTSKEWYQLNRSWHNAEGQMLASDDYKKIPLFLQHERAWITIVLKAGKGVKRETVAALYNPIDNTYNPNVNTLFLNYPENGEASIIDKPLVGSAKVHYEADVNGGEVDSMNLKFDAIVEPHNYLENPKDDKIASINVSDMHFSFYASNDERFSSSAEADIEAMKAYNLTAGKHLTIEATLSTDRIVFLTAWIEDWTEVITSTICDDYGLKGDPVIVNKREDLINFLGNSDLNRSGNVAIIAATELDLDKNDNGDDDSWSQHNGYTLNATINLAGAKVKTSSRLFSSIGSTGNLVHGTVIMTNAAPMNSAIAQTNEGTIDNIELLPGRANTTVTRAGFVETNSGYLIGCSSSIPVIAGNESSNVIIGGIAAESKSIEGGSQPTIDHCTMYAAVKGGQNVRGGGIVGKAEGRVTNNTFDYGITLSQNIESFKNIVFEKQNTAEMTVGGNSWPTVALNEIAGENNYQSKYDRVIDCQEELKSMLNSTFNQMDLKYRIADDFNVEAQFWKDIPMATEDISSNGEVCDGNVYCELDGNGKTITLVSDGSVKVNLPTEFDDRGIGKTFIEKETVSMLFSNITGYVHDMTVKLTKPLIATPSVSEAVDSRGKYTTTDAIAVLAYSVRLPNNIGNPNGIYGEVRNVNILIPEEDCFVQGANAAGLVCWVHHGGTVDNCNVKGPVLSWTPDNNDNKISDAKRYVGGLVAFASDATIKNCTYYSVSQDKATLTIAENSGKMQTYYGGILGGSIVKDIDSDREEPRVSIVDCASWYQKTFRNNEQEQKDRYYHGAILGFSYYDKDGVSLVGTITESDGMCQGNWWQADMDGVSINGLHNDYNTETTIGRRNAVMPSDTDIFN